MISRIRIQNYRAIGDLTLDLGSKNLLMGLNGAGKTSVFDALASIRELVIEGERIADERSDEPIFPLFSVPRWLRGEKPQSFEQRVELELEGREGPLCYRLVIEHNERIGKSRVLSEALLDGTSPIFGFHEGTVQLYRRNYAEGPTYAFDWNGSAIGTVLHPEIQHIEWFKERLRNTACLRIDAPRMVARSEREEPQPERDLSNFASWYRRALVANAAAGADYLTDIREVLGGMESLDLHDLGQGIMVLRAAFEHPNEQPRPGRRRRGTFWLEFQELSDGQRALIGLYALLHFLLKEGAALCIDEPDNFVALAEIQPWLLAVADRVDDFGAQVLIASHHPEILNLLAADHGIVLERDGSGPTRARPYHQDPEYALSPAETVARGWERE